MAVNVSAGNLFSVWLLCKLIFLLVRLSSALTSKLLAEILNTHFLSTVDNVEKIFKKIEVVKTMQVFAERVTNM